MFLVLAVYSFFAWLEVDIHLGIELNVISILWITRQISSPSITFLRQWICCYSYWILTQNWGQKIDETLFGYFCMYDHEIACLATKSMFKCWIFLDRPKAEGVLCHPFFWSSETCLSFLRDASDRVELEDRELESKLLDALESTAKVAVGGNWNEKLEPEFLGNIGRYRRYKFDSVRDLLRVIRNKLSHYRELPLEIQVGLFWNHFKNLNLICIWLSSVFSWYIWTWTLLSFGFLT